MDDLVRKALARWPDVPDCTGWLALDARGRWRIGEAKEEARQPITHAAMNAFIARNYAAVGNCWAFQNGPQRVFVELEYTPYVWRLMPRAAGAWSLVAHTGDDAVPTAAWLDGDGRFVIEARPASGPAMVGVVHDHDTALVAALLHDDAGNELDDDTIAQLVATESGLVTATSPARLRWARGDGEAPLDLPLQRIEAHQVPGRFGFDPRPSLSVRVDVDTRR